ncbi:DUF1853 family protein [Caballeronia sp. TF1N1]|uniref:DUF1853 family protein n=1 Tax=Caballeronia sp. TF1N1 TaxID=2878153 RepID=UPI001FD07942|nr:DUF1853 family protein [Caballeronia sp. TF1N1]
MSAPSPDFARIVDGFGDTTVRDLAWLLLSPDLLDEHHAGARLAHPFDSEAMRRTTLAWLAELDAAPDALHAHTRNPKSTRLGIYAESLLEFFLAHGPAARLIAANVQIRRQRRTIGECDFLLETADGARLHWELAVKFYLHIGKPVAQGGGDIDASSGARLPDRFVGERAAQGGGDLDAPSGARLPGRIVGERAAQGGGEIDAPSGARLPDRFVGERAAQNVGADAASPSSRLSDYVGPNLQDRFDLKHARLLTHQSTLTARPEFIALGYEGPWEPRLFIKGRLFYRDEGVASAPEIGEQHLRGWWMTASDWREKRGTASNAHDERAWIVQPRLAWLASRRLRADDANALLAEASVIHARLQEIAMPTMIAAYRRDEAGNWSEESRGFIVPDDWPERARIFAAARL